MIYQLQVFPTERSEGCFASSFFKDHRIYFFHSADIVCSVISKLPKNVNVTLSIFDFSSVDDCLKDFGIDCKVEK